MKKIKSLVEKLLANWLDDVVDVESREPSLWPKSSTQQIPVQFCVLTPSIQRALDQSA